MLSTITLLTIQCVIVRDHWIYSPRNIVQGDGGGVEEKTQNLNLAFLILNAILITTGMLTLGDYARRP